ncbi:ORC CDC6 like AAA ATPase [Cryptosporidium ubiquitum]|uniref:ORC CDC6 like AAA ATPase n=1 Tax=Cryptosporidium ubiquitum TaxID=857276 RepID=A0A1J4MIR0_9CRYT|nr:ORC CDC6 like AAA ATPase [Cryptosporidium ubiquitum]OII74104.1 ORC CDC6 like AAA ATPase [Cryptosporidium ubiquitum]
MSTRTKRCRFHENNSGDEERNKNLGNFEDNFQLEEFNARKILKSLKSEPPINWEFLGRANEFKEISEYLKKCILGNISGIIHISGSPGTGKTCTLNRILDILENNSSKKLGFVKPTNYKVIRTNASKIASNFNKNSGSLNGIALFVHLLELMNFRARIIEEFKIISKNEGFQECIIYFMKQILNKRTKFVVFIDEIDLVRKNRSNGDAVFELFKAIINFPDSGLVLLAVSNTVKIGNEMVKKIGVDLNDNGRIKLMVFSPYSHNTLRDIVLQRINWANNHKNDSIISKAGIELCVRKVASLYGDCRRTLDACYLTLGKFVFERQSQIQKEQINTEEGEDSNLIGVENLSNVSTRENSPTLNRGPQNRQEANCLRRLRTRSMPTNMTVPIGSFQNVIGKIHQSSQGRLQIIKTLPLHQQYVLMGIILAIAEEQNQTKKGYNENFCTEENKLSFSKLTNTEILICHLKRKYQQICAELMTPPEEYKDMLEALESNNIISISNGVGSTKKKSSSFHRGAIRVNNNKESKIELMFPPENVIDALTSLPKLGTIFSSLMPC